MQNQLNFSRDMEREADRIGLAILGDAGFAPQGFTGMFDKLQQAARLNDNGGFPYLRSHPLTTERIADMQSRMPLQAGAPGPADGALDHAMASARARILSNPGVDALRQAAAEAASSGFAALPAARQAGVLYGATLATARLRDFAAAQATLARLEALTSANTPAARLSRLLAAELAAMTGQAAALLPGSGRPELLANTQILMRTGRAGDALSPPADLAVATPARRHGLAGIVRRECGPWPDLAGDPGRRRGAGGPAGLRRGARPIEGGPESSAKCAQGCAGGPYRGVDHRHPGPRRRVTVSRTGARALTRSPG